MTKEQVIEKYVLETENILKRRPDLNINGDFTPDGIKVFCNTQFIEEIKALNIPNVNQQRELLSDFAKHRFENNNINVTPIDNEYIELFLGIL